MYELTIKEITERLRDEMQDEPDDFTVTFDVDADEFNELVLPAVAGYMGFDYGITNIAWSDGRITFTRLRPSRDEIADWAADRDDVELVML